MAQPPILLLFYSEIDESGSVGTKDILVPLVKQKNIQRINCLINCLINVAGCISHNPCDVQ